MISLPKILVDLLGVQKCSDFKRTVVLQKTTKFCKAIILQLKKSFFYLKKNQVGKKKRTVEHIVICF